MFRYITKINITQKRPITLSSITCYEDFSANPDENPKRIKKHIEEDKKRLQWRTPIDQVVWQSKLKVFEPDENVPSTFAVAMQQPIDFSPRGVKNWYIKRKKQLNIAMQGFIPERHEILGNDLAAAHFIVHRGGEVKFLNESTWTKKDENDEYVLPSKYDATKKLVAIKCDNMTLYYEGLENIRRLEFLKFLSFRNVKTFDDWCLDRVSGSGFNKLEILDLSGTDVTENGLNALYRIPTLKLLILDDPERNTGMKLMCAMIEEAYPDIKIVRGTEIHT